MTWIQHVESLLYLAKEMQQDQSLLSDMALTCQKEKFISLIPIDVPPTCKAVLINHFEELYAPIRKSSQSRGTR